MKLSMVFLINCMLFSLALTSCGPSPEEIQATTTRLAFDIFATQTAQAPTITPTFTASPTLTPSPTAASTLTPTSTRTPTVTFTPTPDLLRVGLTLDDLPDGFKPVSSGQLESTVRSYPEGSKAFGFTDDLSGTSIMGVVIPYPGRIDQLAFDQAMPVAVKAALSIMGSDEVKVTELKGLDGIGDASTGVSAPINVGGISLRVDMLFFRRNSVGIVLLMSYPKGDIPPASIGKLALIIDQRILKIYHSKDNSGGA